eukprot:917-Chlamydomonas_euryale.AAC.1
MNAPSSPRTTNGERGASARRGVPQPSRSPPPPPLPRVGAARSPAHCTWMSQPSEEPSTIGSSLPPSISM